MHNIIITIGREYGSGGRLVGKKIAESLGIPFYDKDIITMTARETGLSEEFIVKAEHQKSRLFYNLYLNSENMPIADQVFLAESKIIKRVADEGPCVIVGRCASYLLEDHPNHLSVFVYGPIDERIKRVKEVYGVEAANEKSFIEKQDKSRAAYYNYFTNLRWGDYKNYDLAISSHFGLDIVADIIEGIVKKMGDR